MMVCDSPEQKLDVNKQFLLEGRGDLPAEPLSQHLRSFTLSTPSPLPKPPINLLDIIKSRVVPYPNEKPLLSTFSQQHKSGHAHSHTHPRFLIGRCPEMRRQDHVLLTHVYKQAQSAGKARGFTSVNVRFRLNFRLFSAMVWLKCQQNKHSVHNNI